MLKRLIGKVVLMFKVSSTRKIVVFITITLINIDQLVKNLIVHNLPIQNNISLLHESYIYQNFIDFDFIHILNNGSVYGVFIDNSFRLSHHSVMLFLLVILRVSKQMIDIYLFIAQAMISNLFDRIIYHHVIDFMIFNFLFFNFPALNIADIMILISVLILIYLSRII